MLMLQRIVTFATIPCSYCVILHVCPPGSLKQKPRDELSTFVYLPPYELPSYDQVKLMDLYHDAVSIKLPGIFALVAR